MGHCASCHTAAWAGWAGRRVKGLRLWTHMMKLCPAAEAHMRPQSSVPWQGPTHRSLAASGLGKPMHPRRILPLSLWHKAGCHGFEAHCNAQLARERDSLSSKSLQIPNPQSRQTRLCIQHPVVTLRLAQDYAVQHQLHLRLGEHLLKSHTSKASSTHMTHPHTQSHSFQLRAGARTKTRRHETLATASVATA